STLSEYIRTQSENSKISEWSICVVSNSEQRVFIDYRGGTLLNERKANEDVAKFTLNYKDEMLTLGSNVRNQQVGRNGEYYLISKNQIDDIKDRQVDLTV